MRLFVGDDWAEDHHDIEVMDHSGRRLARARLPEGVAGMTRLHAIVGELAGENDDVEAVVGIETDLGPRVRALVTAGYTVLAVNPLQAARFRDRLGSPAPRATRGTPACWLTWSAPTATNCARLPATPRRPRRSRWSPGPTRR